MKKPNEQRHSPTQDQIIHDAVHALIRRSKEQQDTINGALYLGLDLDTFYDPDGLNYIILDLLGVPKDTHGEPHPVVLRRCYFTDMWLDLIKIRHLDDEDIDAFIGEVYITLEKYYV